MTQVLLRELVEELRGHLRDGRYDQALALGRHILQSFPKHLETYRLLGETHLEVDELDNAADLFGRVRSADPENVIALIGLSIIHERRGELDEAIWHLERAFDAQPANVDLRAELSRLMAARDGHAPDRVKVTPAGLARLYVRQGLYAQAIRELRALLRSDPRRSDLQAALAEALYREGKMQEAARVCQDLLAELPYCLKANLILGHLWKENQVPEGEDLSSRAREVDPDGIMAQDLGIEMGEVTPPTLPEPEGRAATPSETTIPVTPEAPAVTPTPVAASDKFEFETLFEAAVPPAPDAAVEPMPFADTVEGSGPTSIESDTRGDVPTDQAALAAPPAAATAAEPTSELPAWLQEIMTPPVEPVTPETPAPSAPAAAVTSEQVSDAATPPGPEVEAVSESPEPALPAGEPLPEWMTATAGTPPVELEVGATRGAMATLSPTPESEIQIRSDTIAGEPPLVEAAPVAYSEPEAKSEEIAPVGEPAPLVPAAEASVAEVAGTAPIESAPVAEVAGTAPVEPAREVEAAPTAPVPEATIADIVYAELTTEAPVAEQEPEVRAVVPEELTNEAPVELAPEEPVAMIGASPAAIETPPSAMLAHTARVETTVEPTTTTAPAAGTPVEPGTFAADYESLFANAPISASAPLAIESVPPAEPPAATQETEPERVDWSPEEFAEPVATAEPEPERAEEVVTEPAAFEPPSAPAAEPETLPAEEVPELVAPAPAAAVPAFSAALPTVAPTIPGALNKLPVWLLRFIARRSPDAPSAGPEPAAPLPAVASAPPAAGVEPGDTEVLPGWLHEAAPPASLPLPPPLPQPAEDEGLPDWLKPGYDMQAESEAPRAISAETALDAAEPGADVESESDELIEEEDELLEAQAAEPADAIDFAQPPEPPAEPANLPLPEPPPDVPLDDKGIPIWSEWTAPTEHAAEAESQAETTSAEPAAPSTPAAAEETAGPVNDRGLPTWLKAAPSETPTANEPVDEEGLPDWLKSSNVPPVTPTALPGVEAAASAPVVEPRLPEPGTAPAESTASLAPASEPAPAAAGSSEVDEMLGQARELRAAGELGQALELYEKVLPRGSRALPQIIAELEQFVREPNAPSGSHRLLGDAYAMAGRFKESLEQYRQVQNK